MREKVDFFVLIILYFIFFYNKWKKKGKDIFFVNTTMYIYLSFVLYFTLMPILKYIPSILYNIIFYRNYQTMNLVPFIDVSMGRGDFMRQIILNVVMTVPFGFLLPLTNRKKNSLINTIFWTFLLSFSIEIMQLIINSGRSSDITDIITNVIGGVIGYFIYLIFKPLVIRILDFIKNL